MEAGAYDRQWGVPGGASSNKPLPYTRRMNIDEEGQMRPEILVLGSGWMPEVREELERRFVCHHLAQVAPEERQAYIARVAPGVRGVFTSGTVGIDAQLAAQLPQLEIVAVHGVGVDAVDFAALTARGIPVTNTPDVLTDDVADLAVALLLAAARRVPLLDRYVRDGGWKRSGPWRPAAPCVARWPASSAWGASARRWPRAWKASACRSATTSAARRPSRIRVALRFWTWRATAII